ncbi:uncharacterized protein N7518_002672 [Penicillium psychrosexuale]|uniref:uncharacterized protein n=1 Tax=Penicillium psychrosexuale TaxID=1002107 RepID=UPI0025458D5C|nr:uncharacterized protein N7518_002672 [Penicillium psychrosexuale]KAJ5800604.1 hypothetical protein N7518_002672 [Penicillium psychrosexuale]
MPPNQSTPIPSDITQWKKAAKRAEATLRTSIHTRDPFKSGSKIFEDEERAYDKNEELVNASLVIFLQAVCAKHSDVDSDWNQRDLDH